MSAMKPNIDTFYSAGASPLIRRTQSLKAVFIIFTLLFFLTQETAFASDAVLGILWFKSDKANSNYRSALYSSLEKSLRSNRLRISPEKASSKLWYPYSDTGPLSQEGIREYDSIAGKLHCSHLIMGSIISGKKSRAIHLRLYSVKDKDFVYSTYIYSPYTEDPGSRAWYLGRKVSLFLDNSLPDLTDLTISLGSSYDTVMLSWKCNAEGAVFAIYRSCYSRGSYEKISETSETTFADTSAEPGIKYWYRVVGVSKGVSGTVSSGYGYRKPRAPEGLTVEGVISTRNKPWIPDPVGEEEMRRRKLHMFLMEYYYESYFMATFIFMVGRIYVNRGDIIVYRDFPVYSFNKNTKTLYLRKPGVLYVKFYSDRISRFIRDMGRLGITEEILPRLMSNAIVYCIRTGEIEEKGSDGKIRYVPSFEAMGLSTEYVRDYKKWKSRTVVFATSDKKLYKRIKEAESKGY